MPRDPFVLKMQRELGHPKCARKVSGLSRNGPLVSRSPVLHCLFYYFQGFDINKRCRMLREMVTASGYDPRAVFELMLNTAQFELKLKEVR